MFGRKTGFLASMMTALLLLGGCGTNGTVDETQARNWYNEMTKENGTMTNDHSGDGYGNYTGGPDWGDNGAERNSYGMRTDDGTTLGQDIRNAWDDVKNDVKNMGSNNDKTSGK